MSFIPELATTISRLTERKRRIRSMRVLYLTQVFELASDPGSDRHLFHCKRAVEAGHEVLAITSNIEYKTATVRHKPAGLCPVKTMVDGVAVCYVYSFPHFRGSFKRRFLYYLTYLIAAVVTGLFAKKHDVIYAVSSPLTVGVAAYLLSRLKGVPFVLEVTDVWPDAAVATRVLTSPRLVRLATFVEHLCYRKAARIVVLSEGVKAHITRKGVPAGKFAVISNGVDLGLFGDSCLEKEGYQIREREGWRDQFVCLYLGAHGTYNSLWTIIEVAEALRRHPDISVILVGDGDEKPRLQAMAEEVGLHNVQFFPPFPRKSTPALLRAADVFLLPNRKGEYFKLNLPNKLFDFLVSGRPVVVAGHGDTADLVQRAMAGRVVQAEDGAAMAQAILELRNLGADERARMGESGRQYVLDHYNRDDLSLIFLGVLESVVQSDEREA